MENVMNRIVLIALLVMGVAGSAWAQSGSLSQADKEYLMKDRSGAAYELDAAKLAVQKASSSDVKSYAEKLVTDHEQYNAALDQLGKQEGVTLPTAIDPTDKAHMAELQQASGKTFDTMFIKDAVRVNAQDKQTSDKEKASTKSEAIKNFIAKFADMDAEHEKMAKQLEMQG